MQTASTQPPNEITIQTAHATLKGFLVIPDSARGLVVFAHGSGSSRFSSRNQYMADQLNDAGMATLLFDLLTTEEQEVDERSGELRFDIALLSERLGETVDWAARQDSTAALPLGLFGASTGAAAALNAAAGHPEQVRAVVSRGGRPDLAPQALPQVKAPTLLIVGGNDYPVIEMNERAAAAMRAEHRLEIVPGATHLFSEPGKLEAVARLVRDWFQQYLRG